MVGLGVWCVGRSCDVYLMLACSQLETVVVANVVVRKVKRARVKWTWWVGRGSEIAG